MGADARSFLRSSAALERRALRDVPGDQHPLDQHDAPNKARRSAASMMMMMMANARSMRRSPVAAGVEVSAEDALIGATADLRAMAVLTANARHFTPMGICHVDLRAGRPPNSQR
jgi:predicted nucleic acid-binding protein